jgi:SpoVK/Ycf46/Vps4 family AAA+-type ATPase
MTLKKITLALFVFNFLNIPFSTAMYRGFARARIARIVVPTLGFATLYSMSDRKIFAQSKPQPTDNDDEYIQSTQRALQINTEPFFHTIQDQTFEEALQYIAPKSLLNEERYKNKPARETILERIGEEWIGELPYQLNTFIFDLVDYKTEEPCVPNRIILYGESGFGKTLLVKTMANQLEFPLFSFPASIFVNKYMGETSKRIRAALSKAEYEAKRLNTPVIVFIDEIDAIAGQRTQHTSDEFSGIRATLLTEIEKFSTNKLLYIFVATNKIDCLDDAFKNRFGGLQCEIKALSLANKAKLIKRYFAEESISDDTVADGLAEILSNQKTSYDNLSRVSNREIKHIAQMMKSRKRTDCKMDGSTCNRHYCYYVREALEKMHGVNFEEFATCHLEYIKEKDKNHRIPGLNKILNCHNKPMQEFIKKKEKEMDSGCTII